MPRLVKIGTSTISEKLRRLAGQVAQDPEPIEMYNCIQPVIDVTPLGGVVKAVVVQTGYTVAQGLNGTPFSSWVAQPGVGKRWILLGASVTLTSLGTSTSLKILGINYDTTDPNSGSQVLAATANGAVTGVVNDALGWTSTSQTVQFELLKTTNLQVWMGATVGNPQIYITATVLEVDAT